MTTHLSPLTTHQSLRDCDAGGWVVSLAFWLCLLAAAGLYGLVALAPRWLNCLKLEAEHSANQVRLVTLEREVERLTRVGQALTDEPAFAAELARVDFRPAPHAERIPVDLPLHLNVGHPSSATPTRSPSGTLALGSGPAAGPPWHVAVLEPFATQADVRRGTLAAAAVLALFAFAFLHDGHADQARHVARGLRAAGGRLVGRYRRRRAG